MVETWAYRSIKLLWILLAKTKFSDLIYMSDRLSKLICILDKCLGAILLKDLFYLRLKVIEWSFCRETFVFWSALQNTGVKFRTNQHSETYMHFRLCLEGFAIVFQLWAQRAIVLNHSISVHYIMQCICYTFCCERASLSHQILKMLWIALEYFRSPQI